MGGRVSPRAERDALRRALFNSNDSDRLANARRERSVSDVSDESEFVSGRALTCDPTTALPNYRTIARIESRFFKGFV